jgi:mannose-6-phosphate isomerase
VPAGSLSPAPYPLTFKPFLLPKVWGGERLARYGKPVKEGDTIGESWELVDLIATTESGAGGGTFQSVIANGPLKGRTLHDALELWRGAIMGSGGLTLKYEFPLLIKLLDARENLSVQVHPSPAYAARHPAAHLKTECWYILEAEPGSLIYKGLKPGVTRESFVEHIEDGTVVDDLVAVPAVPGDCHELSSGTVHALGAGVLVAEVQTPSDTTFRVYDWGRKGRKLHIEQSLECVDFEDRSTAGTGVTRLDEADRWTTLVRNRFFTIDEIRLPDAQPYMVRAAMLAIAPQVLIVLAGELTIEVRGEPPLKVGPGRTVLVPAAERMRGWQPQAEMGTRVLAVEARAR